MMWFVHILIQSVFISCVSERLYAVRTPKVCIPRTFKRALYLSVGRFSASLKSLPRQMFTGFNTAFLMQNLMG